MRLAVLNRMVRMKLYLATPKKTRYDALGFVIINSRGLKPRVPDHKSMKKIALNLHYVKLTTFTVIKITNVASKQGKGSLRCLKMQKETSKTLSLLNYRNRRIFVDYLLNLLITFAKIFNYNLYETNPTIANFFLYFNFYLCAKHNCQRTIGRRRR